MERRTQVTHIHLWPCLPDSYYLIVYHDQKIYGMQQLIQIIIIHEPTTLCECLYTKNFGKWWWSIVFHDYRHNINPPNPPLNTVFNIIISYFLIYWLRGTHGFYKHITSISLLTTSQSKISHNSISVSW